jgi:hypothetical protein
LPNFRDILSIPFFKGLRNPKKFWSLKMGPICCPETSVRYYHCKLHVIYDDLLAVVKNIQRLIFTVLAFSGFDWNFSKHISASIIIYPLQSSTCVFDLLRAHDSLKETRRHASQCSQLWPRDGPRRNIHATPNLMCCDVPLAVDIDTNNYEYTIVVVNFPNIRYVETLSHCYNLFYVIFLKVLKCLNYSLKQQTPV